MAESLPLGQKVVVHSLKNAAVLNGLVGAIVGHQGERVSLDFGPFHGTKALKPANLREIRQADIEEIMDHVAETQQREGKLKGEALARHRAGTVDRFGLSHAPPELLRAACSKLVTIASSYLVYESGSNKGRLFFEKQRGALLKDLDAIAATNLPLEEKLQPAVEDESQEFTPHEVLLATKASFETIVLATIFCPGWKNSWFKSFLGLIFASYRSCCMFWMYAIKGGPETDMEIRAIEEVMWLLGFSVHKFRVEGDNKRREWLWQIKRPSGKDFSVYLNQYPTVESFREDGMVSVTLAPYKHFQRAPDLSRFAVVSCPLKDMEGKPVHDILNQTLVQGLDSALDSAGESWTGLGSFH
jgi:hypothetical protein